MSTITNTNRISKPGLLLGVVFSFLLGGCPNGSESPTDGGVAPDTNPCGAGLKLTGDACIPHFSKC